MLDQALGVLAGEVAIDLGTSNTLVFVRGRGIVIDEPSVVAIERVGATSRVVAVGAEAARMVGRTPENIRALRPIREGVIAEFQLAEALLKALMERALGGRPLVRPRALVCVPQGLSDVERRAVQESTRSAGAREVTLVGKPLAAAIGAEMPIHAAAANTVLDIGGGTTEVAIVSLGGIVQSASIRVAGTHLDQAIVDHVKARHGVLLGERTAEEIKLRIGSALPPVADEPVRVKGRDLKSGIPKDVTIGGLEVHEAILPVLDTIVEGFRQLLARTPPELAADVLDSGVMLCGGTALLRGIDEYLRQRTGLPVVCAEDPERTVALGGGRLLDDSELLARIAL
jgi:rod shape-determining protein MreB and related proteins